MIKGCIQIYLIIKCKKFINLIWYMLTTWVSEKKNLGNLSSLHHRGAGDGNRTHVVSLEG